MSNLPHVRSNSGEEVIMELDDTQALRALTAEGHLPSLLILSRDPELIATVRKAAPTGMSIRDAASVDDVADRMSASEPGVLLVDSSGANDIAAMLAQLTQHFPEMVAVVAGKREDSGALLRLTAEGRVFRFLLTPLSHGQTRLALKAAAAQHIDLKASGQRRAAAGPAEPKRNYIAAYGALAAGLLVVIAGVWFAVNRMTREPSTPTAERAATPTASSLPQRIDPVSAELALAREAFDAGRYLEPRGESALDFYRSALALDPNSEQAKSGVRGVAEKILAQAEAALTAERVEEAVRSVETARDIDPTHPRLAFLDVQIGRERERMKLTQARGVDQRIRTLVAQAAEHVRNERLISPTSGNARAALLEARKLDPTDPGVAQGIRELTASLTNEARDAVAAGKLKDAGVFVDAARQLGAAGVALSSVERQLADATKGPSSPLADAPSKPAPAAAAPAAASAEPTVSGERVATTGRDNAAPVEPDVAATKQPMTTAPVQAASIPRTKEVAAQYPRQALLSAIEGWVDLEFIISPEGVPTDIAVKGSQPRRTFDRAAMEALRQWRFQPIVREGAPVAQPAVLRMTFKPT